jgi:hypothetical protein
MTITSYGIGTTSSVTPLKSLGTSIPNPKPPFKYYAKTDIMASSKVVGRGLPIIAWQWGFLTRAQRDQLRQFCIGASSIVYITTITNDNADAFAMYKCRMKWPETDDRDASRRINFTLTFLHCEAQS